MHLLGWLGCAAVLMVVADGQIQPEVANAQVANTEVANTEFAGAEIVDTVETAASETYIVHLRSDADLEQFLSKYPRLRAQEEGRVEFGAFKAFYGSYDNRLIRWVRRHSQVMAVTRNLPVRMMDVQASSPRHLARLSQKYRLKDTELDYVYDPTAGDGVDVYMLDSGLATVPGELENMAPAHSADFTGEGLGDRNGHGTYVAGVVASKTYGVAKRARLVEVKVVNSSGESNIIWLLRGLQHIAHQIGTTRRPSAILMALGTTHNTVLDRAVEALVNSGVPVVAAAGNNEVSACEWSPGSARGSLTIGSFDDRTEMLATFTNHGPCVDAFAPGVSVKSISKDGVPVRYSGTSASAAAGAGLVAYYMGMGHTGDDAVERIKELLVRGKLDRRSFLFRPRTKNAILYNDAGEPIW